MWVITLETVKDNTVVEANLLVHEEGLHICSLVPRQLNDFARILVLLDGSVTGKVLLEGLTNSLDIQIVSKPSDGGDTFAPTTLLNTDVDLFLGLDSIAVPSVLERVWCESRATTPVSENQKPSTRLLDRTDPCKRTEPRCE
jgi:hypothetical protein